MIASLAHASPGHGPSYRAPRLTGLFWAFSYVLLSIRGAIFHDDWGRLIDNNRLLAVSVGAGAFWLVQKHLGSGRRISLREAIVWIFGATLAVMVVRLTLDELMFDVPQGLGVNLLWSLTWSAYFGLWVMASLAFAPSEPVLSPAASIVCGDSPAQRTVVAAAHVDNLELLVAAVIAEAAELKVADRTELAARVLALGGYESPELSPLENERARLALRIAARIAKDAR